MGKWLQRFVRRIGKTNNEFSPPSVIAVVPDGEADGQFSALNANQDRPAGSTTEADNDCRLTVQGASPPIMVPSEKPVSYREAREEIYTTVTELVRTVVQACDAVLIEQSEQPWLARIFQYYEQRLNRIAKQHVWGVGLRIAFIELVSQHLYEITSTFGQNIDPDLQTAIIDAGGNVKSFNENYPTNIAGDKNTNLHSEDLKVLGLAHTNEDGEVVSWIGAGLEEEKLGEPRILERVREPESPCEKTLARDLTLYDKEWRDGYERRRAKREVCQSPDPNETERTVADNFILYRLMQIDGDVVQAAEREEQLRQGQRRGRIIEGAQRKDRGFSRGR